MKIRRSTTVREVTSLPNNAFLIETEVVCGNGAGYFLAGDIVLINGVELTIENVVPWYTHEIIKVVNESEMTIEKGNSIGHIGVIGFQKSNETESSHA